MFASRRTVLSAALGLGAALAAVPLPIHSGGPGKGDLAASAGARLVGASVRKDGVELLKTSTSDDGSPDADAVWAYLERLRFTPTEAFLGMLPNKDAEEFTLSSRDEKGQPVQRRLELEIAYGGWAFPHTLRLVKRDANQRGEVWAVDPKIIESHASLRFISRYAASLLEDQ